MRALFFTTDELNLLLKEVYDYDNVKIGFSEEIEEDVVEWYDETNTILKDFTLIDELLPLMNEKYNVSIQSIEITEYKPLTFGYLFPFE